MSGHPGSTRRDISHNSFNDHTRINLGDVHNHVHYSSPRPMPHAGVIHVIPYPRNEDLVHRQDLMKRLDELLPSTPESCSAALWSLGGSGKTQIALNYAYRRCDTAKNAASSGLFGVGQQAEAEEENEQQSQSLRGYIPCAPQGTILWTSRDGHIAGTLVGARRSIEVRSMAIDEARKLLVGILDMPSIASKTSIDAGIDALLEELQYLPLVISQAGAYMKRLLMTAEDYLGCLKQGKSRWDVLGVSDSDWHRCPEVSNSVLETWKISTERIRIESEISYHILHVIAYVDNQDIPQELLASTASSYAIGSEDHEDDGGSTTEVPELEVLQAVARLKEFSFLNLRRTDDGERRYEMHKLVQEAIRYDLMIRSLTKTLDRACDGSKDVEALYSRKALQILRVLIPRRIERTSWAQYEKQKVLGEEHPDTLEAMGNLALNYSGLGLYDKARGIHQEVLELQRQMLGEENPETLISMRRVGMSLFCQGQYDKAEILQDKALKLQRSLLGEKHYDTIRSMTNLGRTYLRQNRHVEAQEIMSKALEISEEALGEKHWLNFYSNTTLAETYFAHGQYEESEEILVKTLGLGKEVLGQKHPITIYVIRTLANVYYEQGRHNDAESLFRIALDLNRQVLGDSHPNTINTRDRLAHVQEMLQHCRSPTKSAESFAEAEMEGRKERFRSLWEVMRKKVGKLRISRSSQGQK
ncbi:unnamed protein product [Fusarium langsethiae]|nr:unnamed protein product [Fusarium langsethiae]